MTKTPWVNKISVIDEKDHSKKSSKCGKLVLTEKPSLNNLSLNEIKTDKEMTVIDSVQKENKTKDDTHSKPSIADVKIDYIDSCSEKSVQSIECMTPVA